MRLEHRGLKIAGLLAFSAVCVAIFVYLFTAAGGKLRLHQPYSAKVRVPTAFQLVPNADVRHAGVKIGVVNDITNVGDTGEIQLELKDQYAPLYRDATVRVRTKTLVGENYLEVNPGTPSKGKLPDGATLPLEQAEEAVQLDQILSSLDPRTRHEVRRNLDALGPGFKGRGDDLNRLWAAMKPTARDGGTVLRVLAGQRREFAAIIDDTAEVMQAFGDRTADVRTLATQAKHAAIAASSRDDEFRAAIRELDPTLRQARSSLARIGSFSDRSRPVVADLADVMTRLEPVMRDLRPAITQTRALFRELPGAMRAATPLLDQLRPFSRQLSPAIASVDAFLRQANPSLDFLKPYAPELGGVFANNGSVFEAKDAVGHKGRVHAIISQSSYTGFTPEMKAAIDALITTGAFEKVDGERLNAYPQPGTINEPNTSSAFKRVEAAPGR